MLYTVKPRFTPYRALLFILLLQSDFPVATAFDNFYTCMIEDTWKSANRNPLNLKLQLLHQLQLQLSAQSSRKLRNFGIDVPENFGFDDSELLRAKTAQLHLHQADRDNELLMNAFATFTEEQRLIFDEVTTACARNDTAMLDIRGRAGSGKTMLLNAICAKARLMGHLTAPSAATGLAAFNQPFGLTFHRTWEIPVADPRDDRILDSNLQLSKRRAVMDAVKLCTIDEAPSIHIAAFEAAARATFSPAESTTPLHTRDVDDPFMYTTSSAADIDCFTPDTFYDNVDCFTPDTFYDDTDYAPPSLGK